MKVFIFSVFSHHLYSEQVQHVCYLWVETNLSRTLDFILQLGHRNGVFISAENVCLNFFTETLFSNFIKYVILYKLLIIFCWIFIPNIPFAATFKLFLSLFEVSSTLDHLWANLNSKQLYLKLFKYG